MNNSKQEGKRHNQNKLRYDLLSPCAIEEMVKVMTFGTTKYDDDNWKKGMKWSIVLASLKRHIAEFEKGVDFDKESGLLHLSHAATNIMFLLEYYKICPQHDDRDHSYYSNKRVGYDIDDVLADFTKGYKECYDIKDNISVYNNRETIKNLQKDFWVNLKCKTNPSELKYKPVCYITHRECLVEWTKEWLFKNKFPSAPIIVVTKDTPKTQAAIDNNLDVFIDDNIDVFLHMNKNSDVMCWLFDTENNRDIDIGFKRIKNVSDI